MASVHQAGLEAGMLAFEFITPKRFREIGRELMKLANEIERKPVCAASRGARELNQLRL